MMNFIAGIVLILFYAYLAFTFTTSVSLILNVIIITALYLLIRRDLKDPDNHKYYIASLLLTALFFIFSGTQFVSYILGLSERLSISIAVIAGLLAYIFAQFIGLVYELYHYAKEKTKNRIS